MSVDRVIFVCILVLTAVYFYATAQIPTLEIGDPLGPKAFPRLLGIGLLITAGLLFFEMRTAAKRPQPAATQPHAAFVQRVVVGENPRSVGVRKVGHVHAARHRLAVGGHGGTAAPRHR